MTRNVTKYKVMTWDYEMGRYIFRYTTEFGNHIHPNEARIETLRCDPDLPDGFCNGSACETILVRVGTREDRQRTYAAYDAARGYDLDDEGNSFHDYD